MNIELIPYERHSLETLEQRFGVNPVTVVGFAQSLNVLRSLYRAVSSGPETDLRGGRVVIMGLINYAHHLLMGGLHSLETGNGIVWSSCVRGLVETFGACVLISEKPGAVIRHLDDVPAGKLYNAARRAKPELGRDIERLHQIVHPGAGAIYSSFKVAEPKERTVNFAFGLRPPQPAEGREAVTVLANFAVFLEEALQALANNPQVLSTGKVIMVRDVAET